MGHLGHPTDGTAMPSTLTSSTIAASNWPVVHVVDGLCAAGKSRAAIEEIAPRVLAGERFLIAGPTTDQCRQFAADLTQRLNALWPHSGTARVHLVNSEDQGLANTSPRSLRSVQQTLAQTVECQPAGRGCAIIITHAALFATPRNDMFLAWHLLIDEAPPLVLAEEINLPNTAWKTLRFDGGTGPDDPVRLHGKPTRLDAALRAARKSVTDLNRLGSAAEGRGRFLQAATLEGEALRIHAEQIEPLQTLQRRLRSGNWIIRPPSGRTEASTGDDTSRCHRLRLTTGRSAKIVLTSEIDWGTFLGLDRRRWQSVTLMAANAQHSLAVQSLHRQGITVTEERAISPRLRFHDAHPNGHLVTILYATPQRLMSKRLWGQDMGGQTYGQRILDAVEREFAGEPFCWSANSDLPSDALSGERMPAMAHGLNRFQHYERVAALALMNLSPPCLDALEELGFSREIIRRAIALESVYQAVCRCVIRNLISARPVVMIVPDRDSADFVAARFPGCRVAPLDVAVPAELSDDSGVQVATDPVTRQMLPRAQLRQRSLDNASEHERRRLVAVSGVTTASSVNQRLLRCGNEVDHTGRRFRCNRPFCPSCGERNRDEHTKAALLPRCQAALAQGYHVAHLTVVLPPTNQIDQVTRLVTSAKRKVTGCRTRLAERHPSALAISADGTLEMGLVPSDQLDFVGEGRRRTLEELGFPESPCGRPVWCPHIHFLLLVPPEQSLDCVGAELRRVFRATRQVHIEEIKPDKNFVRSVFRVARYGAKFVGRTEVASSLQRDWSAAEMVTAMTWSEKASTKGMRGVTIKIGTRARAILAAGSQADDEPPVAETVGHEPSQEASESVPMSLNTYMLPTAALSLGRQTLDGQPSGQAPGGGEHQRQKRARRPRLRAEIVTGPGAATREHPALDVIVPCGSPASPGVARTSASKGRPAHSLEEPCQRRRRPARSKPGG
jgi:hypothetical protein